MRLSLLEARNIKTSFGIYEACELNLPTAMVLCTTYVRQNMRNVNKQVLR